MTREEELALLIAEQRADDTNFVQPEAGCVSIDAVKDYIAQDDKGRPVSLLRNERGTVLQSNSAPWHGTVGGYRNHGCKCVRCKAAKALAQKQRRQRLKQANAA